MRKLLVSLLLAGALVPGSALAERVDRDRSSDSKSSSEDRPQRAERSSPSGAPARIERAERPARIERADRPARIERADHSLQVERVERVNRQSGTDRRIERRAARPIIQTEPIAEPNSVEPTQQVRTTERSGSGFVGGLRDAIRDQSHDGDWDRDRDRDRDRWRDGDRRHRWSGDWRRDRRYDWSNYRNRYSSLFRLGRYYDPYGWNYRRFSIGFSLWPSYYGSSHWLNDPWMYRLPPAYGPYRWVRYYDDALLVNIYTGQVVDVVYNFFW